MQKVLIIEIPIPQKLGEFMDLKVETAVVQAVQLLGEQLRQVGITKNRVTFLWREKF